MRLFVGVWPPEEVLEALAGLERADVPGVRWVGREQWHVTLRFLGEVDDFRPAAEALAGAPLRATEAGVGPQARTLGRGVLYLPVHGLDELAAGVRDATAAIGQPPDERAFRGHLTLARAAGRRGRLPVGLAGTVPGFEASFPVHDVRLVRSHLGRGGPRYEDVEVVALA